MSRCLRLLLVLGLLAPAAVLAEEPVDAEVTTLRASYEYGRYAEVLERAGTRIDRGRLAEKDLAELHKLAGLSAFNLNRTEDSARHFRALLRLEPDFNLDPFAVPPPAVKYLDGIREQMSAELELVRQERRLRVERERAETERRERERVASEEQRRRVEELSRQVTVRQVETRSFLVNFVPFGAGQFQQGRTGLGTLLRGLRGRAGRHQHHLLLRLRQPRRDAEGDRGRRPRAPGRHRALHPHRAQAGGAGLDGAQVGLGRGLLRRLRGGRGWTPSATTRIRW